MKICLIIGTRPEIIKMSPIIKECKKRHFDFFILHTNQHYSENLDRIFFRDLDLPKPKYNLRIGSGTHGKETGKMLIGIEKVLLKEKPDVVLIVGDTNTVLAGALAAVKLHIKIAHIESGVRSYFREMPEEINRIVADHISDFLFTASSREKDILIDEGIDKEKIFIVGNTIADAVYQNLEIAKKKSMILKKINLQKGKYFLATIHRQENVDKKDRLKAILDGFNLIYKKFNFPIIYPIHPRTQKRLKEFKLKIPKGIKLFEPIGYLDFLQLEFNANLILTDSGGVQEESCILKIPSLTLRDNYEWPETLETGGNILVGANPQKILKGAEEILKKTRDWGNPFGNGKSAEMIMEILYSKL